MWQYGEAAGWDDIHEVFGMGWELHLDIKSLRKSLRGWSPILTLTSRKEIIENKDVEDDCADVNVSK